MIYAYRISSCYLPLHFIQFQKPQFTYKLILKIIQKTSNDYPYKKCQCNFNNNPQTFSLQYPSLRYAASIVPITSTNISNVIVPNVFPNAIVEIFYHSMSLLTFPSKQKFSKI